MNYALNNWNISRKIDGELDAYCDGKFDGNFKKKIIVLNRRELDATCHGRRDESPAIALCKTEQSLGIRITLAAPCRCHGVFTRGIQGHHRSIPIRQYKYRS